MKTLILIGAIAALAAGCGNGTDPLDALGDSTVVPSMGAPVGSTSGSGITVFSASHPSYEFTTGFGFGTTGGSVLAPAGGLVVSIANSSDAVNPNGSITIAHNARYSTRLSRLTSITVRAGDIVAANAAVATTLQSLQWEVFVDATAVCPYTFLNSTGLAFVNARLVGQPPCQ